MTDEEAFELAIKSNEEAKHLTEYLKERELNNGELYSTMCLFLAAMFGTRAFPEESLQDLPGHIKSYMKFCEGLSKKGKNHD